MIHTNVHMVYHANLLDQCWTFRLWDNLLFIAANKLIIRLKIISFNHCTCLCRFIDQAAKQLRYIWLDIPVIPQKFFGFIGKNELYLYGRLNSFEQGDVII